MTDWEARYQVGDIPWEKGQAAPPLLELLERRGREIWGNGPILVPGCGLGHDVRELARHGLEVVGLDLSATAVERAREFPRVGSERYEQADFLDSAAWCAERRFSAIWEHTCFCAIDPAQRTAYAESAAGVLQPGGMLAGVFFLTPFDPDEEGSGPPFPSTVDEVMALLAPWFDHVDGWVPEWGYEGRVGREWIGIFRRRVEG